MPTSQQIAKALYATGCIAVPTQVGSRRPMMPYQHWRVGPPTPSEYTEMWQTHANADISVLCGTGNDQAGYTHCIDVDRKNGAEIADAFVESAKGMGLGLYEEVTASGGTHFWFRLPQPTAGFNPAWVADESGKFKPVIEFRGDRHLCRIFPSSGIQAITSINAVMPTLTEQQFAALIELAERFNQRLEVPADVKYERRVRVNFGASPGDDYSDTVDIMEVVRMLEEAGWKTVSLKASRILLRRPNARTNNVDADILVGKRVFKNYSPSDPTFTAGKAYSFFQVFSILKHNSDFTAAAKAAAALGFGESSQLMPPVTQPKPAPRTEVDDIWDDDDDYVEPAPVDPIVAKLLASKIVPGEKRPTPVVRMKYTHHVYRHNAFVPDQVYKIAYAGSLVAIQGEAGARKTAMVKAMVASAIANQDFLGLHLLVEDGGDIVWIDTEQEDYFNQMSVDGVYHMAGVTPEKSRVKLHYYQTGDWGSPALRKKALEAILTLHPNPAVVIVDGLKDMTVDFVGDNKESTSILDYLKYLASADGRTGLVIFVLHVNPGSEKMRGHLGTEAKNKAAVVLEVKYDQASGISEMVFRKTRGARPLEAQAFDTCTQFNLPKFLNTKPRYETDSIQTAPGGDGDKFPSNVPPPIDRSVSLEDF